MKTFAILRAGPKGYIVDARPDGSVGLNARIYAAQDEGDTGDGFAALVAQANAAVALYGALEATLRHARDALPTRSLDAITEQAEAAMAAARNAHK